MVLRKISVLLNSFGILILLSRFRSNHPEVFLEKGVLKICSKFIETALQHGCSPVHLLHIFRTPFTKNTSGWLLQQITIYLIQEDLNDFVERIQMKFYKVLFFGWNDISHLRFLSKFSRPEVFCKKEVLKNFAKFTRKHLCQSLLVDKVADLSLQHSCFPANFAKFLRTTFFTEHFWWLLLEIIIRES